MDIDLRSVAGIAALTLALVEVVKRSIAGTKADKLPVFVWVFAVSSILSFLTVWAGYIHDDIRTVFAQALLQALLASGTYTWITGRSLTTFSGQSPTPPTGLGVYLLLLVGLISVGGCYPVSPREKAFHEGVDALWPEIKGDWKPRVESDTNLSEDGKLLRVGPTNSLASEMDDLLEAHKKAMNNAQVR